MRDPTGVDRAAAWARITLPRRYRQAPVTAPRSGQGALRTSSRQRGPAAATALPPTPVLASSRCRPCQQCRDCQRCQRQQCFDHVARALYTLQQRAAAAIACSHRPDYQSARYRPYCVHSPPLIASTITTTATATAATTAATTATAISSAANESPRRLMLTPCARPASGTSRTGAVPGALRDCGDSLGEPTLARGAQLDTSTHARLLQRIGS